MPELLSICPSRYFAGFRKVRPGEDLLATPTYGRFYGDILYFIIDL